MFKEVLKSESDDLETELMLLLDAYSEFHRVLAFLQHAQHLLNGEPTEITELIADGQWYCGLALRERSAAIKQRIGELYGMVKEGG